MRRYAISSALKCFLGFVGVVLFSTSAARAADHVLTLPELRADISRASAARDADRVTINRFFSQPRVEATLQKAGINVSELRLTTSSLSDQEQAQLAARVRNAQSDLAAGELKDSQVTLIIMAVALFAFLAVLVLAFK